MNFKKEDIIWYKASSGGQIAEVKLLSDPKYDYYRLPTGHNSLQKSWTCKVIHISGPYLGTICNYFFLCKKGCFLKVGFDFTRKKIKSHKL